MAKPLNIFGRPVYGVCPYCESVKYTPVEVCEECRDWEERSEDRQAIPRPSGGAASDSKPGEPERVRPIASLDRHDFDAVVMQCFMAELHRRGRRGPSPGGAASKLGCHRSMIDRLSEMGILEKSVYKRSGTQLVYISTRSISDALEAKQQRRMWTRADKGKYESWIVDDSSSEVPEGPDHD